MVKIEKSVPIPEGSGKGSKKYPFGEMEVGDSFYTENNGVVASVSYWRSRNAPNKEFVTRKEGEGRRVWRIK